MTYILSLKRNKLKLSHTLCWPIYKFLNFIFLFETGKPRPYCVAKEDLEYLILLPPSPKYWDFHTWFAY